MQDDPSHSYLKQRRRMVEKQLRPRGITDTRVLNAMERVPRERFFPERERQQAYSDGAFAIGEGQTISQPYMVAVMTQALRIRPGARVLEIGTGSGYQTAVLAELAGPDGQVHTMERILALHERAQRALGELGYANIRFHVGDGTRGWPEAAPYDAILVTAGAPRIPESLQQQLAPEGHLVIPVGDRGLQHLLDVFHDAGRLHQRVVCECVFVPLVGEEGW